MALDIERGIASRQGQLQKRITKDVHYVAVHRPGPEREPYDSYICSGPDVEPVLRLRRQGSRIQLIREVDLLCALEL